MRPPEEIKPALEYLRRWHDIRCEYDIRSMRRAGLNDAVLTMSVYAVLEYFDMGKPLTNCSGCKNNVDGVCTAESCTKERV